MAYSRPQECGRKRMESGWLMMGMMKSRGDASGRECCVS